MVDEELKKFMEQYKERLKAELEGKAPEPVAKSREYKEFREEILPGHISLYEKACNISEKILRIRPDPKREESLREAINISHLNVTPTGVYTLSILLPIVVILFGITLSVILPVVFSPEAGPSLFFIFFFIITGAILMNPLAKLPEFYANSWRMKASNQMVLSIFYVVTYMRHTSNLELAIEFAAEHLAPPLSLDLKKVMWDVETEKYSSVKESLDAYLETWKKWNFEFVESFHLIESSLYESSEDARLASLNKALSVMLEETYEKMLHFSQELKSPITMLNMLGVVLPILGLVILPLVVNFMQGVKWYHLAILYNILLPIGVYYLSKTIMSTRPTGYGDTDISEINPGLRKYKNKVITIGNTELPVSPVAIAVFVGIIFLLVGLSPLIIHALYPDFDFPNDAGMEKKSPYHLLEFKESKETKGVEVGPYGLGATILSLGIILAIGLSIGLYYSMRSKNLVKIRDDTKKLESEFASSLFQLGNRLGDNLPAEIAFGKVAEVSEGTSSGNFFKIVNNNIRRVGMSVQQAIFDKKIGAIVYYPSAIIESSMKVLIEGVKKGPQVASQAVLSVSEYVKEIHRVNERLRDLLADVISSIQSQITFLTPVIAGIVVGISSMITMILGKLSEYTAQISSASGGEAAGSALPTITTFFGGDVIPTYYMQLIVGIYVVQVLYILIVLSNGIENGADALGEEYAIGQQLTRSTIIYCIVTLIITLLFNFIAGNILTGTLSMG